MVVLEVGMICLIDGSVPLGLHVIWVFRTKDGRNEFFFMLYIGGGRRSPLWIFDLVRT